MNDPTQTQGSLAASSVAAIDLGSNSFHMIVARLVHEELQIVDRLRDRVALAAGLDDSRRLTAKAQKRAIDCLSRFGQRLRDLPPEKVRAVGTSAIRQAKNSDGFLEQAEAALGFPIEVITGREEARLIYLGVAHNTHDEASLRLVIDIGGGSTECILGEQFDTLRVASMRMGCVVWTKRFFPDGKITAKALDAAQLAAQLECQDLSQSMRSMGWETCLGSSGTNSAIAEILRLSGWSKTGITREGLAKLREAMIEAKSIEKLELPGLQEERAQVLPGGFAILAGLMESLDIPSLHPVSGALREGLLYDLLGRLRHEDIRHRTVRSLEQRYHIDSDQALRIERTAVSLFDQVTETWQLANSGSRRVLRWAARLHEIGRWVSYSGFHKHGAYLLKNSDMAGFSRGDQALLATLVLVHRRKLTQDRLSEFLGKRTDYALRLTLLLRLAVLLHRDRSQSLLPPMQLSTEDKKLALSFPPGWLDANPLSRADLAEESRTFAAVGWRLDFE